MREASHFFPIGKQPTAENPTRTPRKRGSSNEKPNHYAPGCKKDPDHVQDDLDLADLICIWDHLDPVARGRLLGYAAGLKADRQL